MTAASFVDKNVPYFVSIGPSLIRRSLEHQMEHQFKLYGLYIDYKESVQRVQCIFCRKKLEIIIYAQKIDVWCGNFPKIQHYRLFPHSKSCVPSPCKLYQTQHIACLGQNLSNLTWLSRCEILLMNGSCSYCQTADLGW